MRKHLSIITVCCLLIAACGHTHEEVVATWPDGSKQTVHILKGKKENAVKVGELRYYANGNLQYEKHFSDDGTTPTDRWNFNHPNGKAFATASFDKAHPQGAWEVFDTNGNSYFNQQYDSVQVVELGEYDTPASLVYYDSVDRHLFQFYSNGSLRCTGMTHNGLREGTWIFYHANGLPQVEANFQEGKENGLYTCYRESGIPYFRGAYINGLRAGVWEFYDEEANLAQTKDYDKH